MHVPYLEASSKSRPHCTFSQFTASQEDGSTLYRSIQKYAEVCRSMQKLATRWRHMTPSVAAISWTTSYFSFTCDMQCISQRSNNSYRADHGPVESYLICQWKNYGGIVPHTCNNEKSTLASSAKQKSPQSSKLWAYVKFLDFPHNLKLWNNLPIARCG